MKVIGVIVNKNRDIALKYTSILANNIAEMGAKVLLLRGIPEELSLNESSSLNSFVELSNEKEIIDNAEIVISLGGDGSFLKVARMAYEKDLPILGINLGSLGFLTEIEKDDIKSAVSNLLNGNYIVEKRMMLDGSIIRNGKVIANDTALNDIVISRGALSKILHLKAYLNDEFVDMFPGDGLIISSPTGSTAYSLSAGGPIVEPNINLIIMSPICPHILYSRSIVTADDRIVKVVVDEDFTHEAMVTVDGQEGYEIKGGDIIIIEKSKYKTNLVRINPLNFFDVLRMKIYFRGECVKRNEIQ